MIFAFQNTESGGIVPAPEIREVFSIWPVTVIVLLSLLIFGAYYVGLRSGRKEANSTSRWSRAEVLAAWGVMVMIATLLVTLLNAEVRKWLGLP